MSQNFKKGRNSNETKNNIKIKNNKNSIIIVNVKKKEKKSNKEDEDINQINVNINIKPIKPIISTVKFMEESNSKERMGIELLLAKNSAMTKDNNLSISRFNPNNENRFGKTKEYKTKDLNLNIQPKIIQKLEMFYYIIFFLLFFKLFPFSSQQIQAVFFCDDKLKEVYKVENNNSIKIAEGSGGDNLTPHNFS